MSLEVETQFVDLTKAFQKEELISVVEISLTDKSSSRLKLPTFFERFTWGEFESINYKFEKWDGRKPSVLDKEFEALFSNGYLPFARCSDANFFDAVCISLDNISGPVYRFDHERKDFYDMKSKDKEFDNFKSLLESEIFETQKYFEQST